MFNILDSSKSPLFNLRALHTVGILLTPLHELATWNDFHFTPLNCVNIFEKVLFGNESDSYHVKKRVNT